MKTLTRNEQQLQPMKSSSGFIAALRPKWRPPPARWVLTEKRTTHRPARTKCVRSCIRSHAADFARLR